MTDVLSPPVASRKKIAGDPTMGVPSDVYAAFSAWCERNSYVRRDVAGKLLRWFMECDEDVIRKVVIGGHTRGLESAYAAFLEDLALTMRDEELKRVTAKPPNHDRRAGKL